MVDEVLDGSHMVGQLFGECQRVMHQTGDALPQGVVEALNVDWFSGLSSWSLGVVKSESPLCRLHIRHFQYLS
jgi:hypothetical protein